jgi:anti-sigma B factor antagonist
MTESTYFGLDLDVEYVDDDTTLVRVRGELDLSTSSRIETDLLRLIHEGLGRKLYLDLAELTFLDSTGLRALWRTRQHAQAANAQLFITAASDPVMRVLKVTKLDRVFRLIGDDQKAPHN